MALFERFQREAPYLQAYGKLPLAKDYLRVGASQGHGRALREWLDHAYSGSVAAKGAAPSLPWPGRFVIGGGADEPLMGSIWASSDRGGERPFPFAIFIERRRKALLTELGEDQSALSSTWGEIESAYEHHRGVADGESFLAWVRERSLALKELPSAALERLPWDLWVRSLWPEEGQDELLEILVSLMRLGSVAHRRPLRLPLVQDLAVYPQVHAWCSALSAAQLLGKGELPTIFFPQATQSGSEPSFCTFFFAPLGPTDAAWIAPKSAHGDLGEGDYTPTVARRAGAEPVAPEHAPLLADSLRGAIATARARTAR
ncbi:MAG: DUF2094 domain-containing protein [Planctomycetes bacterium]|nr:DUF2094 domain-containing protein [Planctomycetota bacterium]